MDFETLIFNETIDKKKVENLLSHPELLGSWIDGYGIERNDREQIIKILNGIKGSNLSVKYSRSKKSNKKDKFGRVYPKGLISLGSLGRKIRGTLTTGTYIDIDIVNCHATLMLFFLKKYEFPHKIYDKYVNNRKHYLEIVKKAYNCSRDEAKRFFIIAGYGGAYNSWFNTLELNSEFEGESQEPLYNLFKHEAKLLANKFIDINPERFKYWKDNRDKTYNHDFGFLGMMLQDHECQVLQTMYLFLVREGLIRNDNAILCHDGLMLKIKSIKKKTLKRLEEEVEKQNGFVLSIINKPLEHFLDELKEEKLIAEGEPMDMQYLINLKTYSEKKEYFERYVCKIIKTGEFIELSINIDERGFKNYSHTTKKETTLVQSYKHFLSHKLFNADEVALKKQAPKSFISKWLCDPEMRTYMDQDWIPYNGVYKQTDNKIYNLFTGYSSVITSPVPDNYLDYVKPLLDILLELCEGEQRNLDFLLHYLAHIIQKPAVKLRYSIIFTGKQGAGKDTILVAMSKILGDGMINSEANPENLCGKHALGLVKKLLVAFNESEAKKTFDFEGVMKSLITDDKLTINPKNLQPYDIKNRARMFIFSNKPNPVKFDGASSDRRFIAFKTTDKYIHKKYGNIWKNMYKLFENPKFASSLYCYLNNIDISSYDFETKRLGVLTDTYRGMVKKQLPLVVEFIRDLIDKYRGSEGYLWKEDIVGEDKKLWAKYNEYLRVNKPEGYVGRKETWKSSFKDLDIPVIFYKVNGERLYKYIPCEVDKLLALRGWSCDNFLSEEVKMMSCEFTNLL